MLKEWQGFFVKLHDSPVYTFMACKSNSFFVFRIPFGQRLIRSFIKKIIILPRWLFSGSCCLFFSFFFLSAVIFFAVVDFMKLLLNSYVLFLCVLINIFILWLFYSWATVFSDNKSFYFPPGNVSNDDLLSLFISSWDIPYCICIKVYKPANMLHW